MVFDQEQSWPSILPRNTFWLDPILLSTGHHVSLNNNSSLFNFTKGVCDEIEVIETDTKTEPHSDTEDNEQSDINTNDGKRVIKRPNILRSRRKL